MTTNDPAAPASDPTANVDPAVPVADPVAPVAPIDPAAPAVPVVPPVDATTDPAAPADPAALEGAPESYEDFTVPDGIVIAPEVADKFKALAKTLNLPQSKAQELIAIATESQAAMLQDLQTQAETTVAGWGEQLRADAEVGGARYDQSVSHAQVALEKFGTPAFSELLETTRYGDHPEWVRFAARVGKAMSEGGFVDGQGEGNKPELKGDNALAARVAAEQARNPRPRKGIPQ